MNKSILVTTGGLIVGLALATAVVNADSTNYDDVTGLNLDIQAAALAATASDAGQIIEIELEMENNRAVWEVEIVNAQNQTLTLEVDGLTGNILSTKTDSDDDSELVSIDSIDLANAIDIVKAVEHGAIIEAELENDDGLLIWEVESISDNNQEKKFRIDAETGEVLI